MGNYPNGQKQYAMTMSLVIRWNANQNHNDATSHPLEEFVFKDF